MMRAAVEWRSATVAGQLFTMLTGVFFIGGFLTSMVSLVVPRLRLMLSLDYTQALLVQLAFHASYLLFAVPITLAVVRVGYMRAIAAGLAVMMAGCIALTLADRALDLRLVLAALLLLSAGITVLQIAANTVVTIVGAAAGAAARLTLLQGFNSLGTVLGPLLAAPLLLAAAGPASAGSALPFVASAAALAALSLLFAVRRGLLPAYAISASGLGSLRALPAVWRTPRLRAGTAAMFAYVGAEVTIGTLLTSFLMQRQVLGLGAVAAGQLVSLYWGGAMVGRFAGAALLSRLAPARLLVVAASGATLLTTVAIGTGGSLAAAALLATGLCNAVMYPTIYALALPADPGAAPLGSMLLCMAVVGGAVVPVATGVAADAVGLAPALALPALCYAGIALFARSCRPVAQREKP